MVRDTDDADRLIRELRLAIDANRRALAHMSRLLSTLTRTLPPSLITPPTVDPVEWVAAVGLESDGSSGDKTITIPAATQSGDLMVLAVTAPQMSGSDPGAATAPGFTPYASNEPEADTRVRLSILYAWADGSSASSSLTVTPDPDSGQQSTVHLNVFRNADSTTPFGRRSGYKSDNGGNPEFWRGHTDADDCMVLAVAGAQGTNTSTAFSDPAGWTRRTNATNGQSRMGATWTSDVIAAGGTTYAGPTQSVSRNGWTTVSLVIQPTSVAARTEPSASATNRIVDSDFASVGVTALNGVTTTDLETIFGVTVDSYGSAAQAELEIVDDADLGLCFRNRYVPASNGSERISFRPQLGTDYTELWFGYDVKFEAGFDFGKGGKLPGLSMGSGPTGGSSATDGATARYMWIADDADQDADGDGTSDADALGPYLYLPGDPGTYGDTEPVPGFDFTTGTVYRIVQRIVLNSDGGVADGELETWVDGELVHRRDDLVWRLGNSGDADYYGGIDAIRYSTFFGGADSSWSPTTTVYSRFGNFRAGTDHASVV